MDLTEQAVIIFSYWLIAKKKKKKQRKTKKNETEVRDKRKN